MFAKKSGSPLRQVHSPLGNDLSVQQGEVLYWTPIVKREQSHKFSIYWLIYGPSLNGDCELWVVTERIRLRISVTEMGFLRREAEPGLTD